MRLSLSLETGDVTSENKVVREFRLAVDRPPTQVRLTLSDVAGEIAFDDWPKLVEQVKNNELVKRHFPQGLQYPLSEVAEVIRQINSTPTFQLFLAGIDLAERIDIASESPTESVKRRFKLLDKWMPSVTGAGGLFFIPEELSARLQPKSAQELILNNKLGVAAFADIKRYYVPYATPLGFIVHASNETEALWDEIRSLYYDFRYSA